MLVSPSSEEGEDAQKTVKSTQQADLPAPRIVVLSLCLLQLDSTLRGLHGSAGSSGSLVATKRCEQKTHRVFRSDKSQCYQLPRTNLSSKNTAAFDLT